MSKYVRLMVGIHTYCSYIQTEVKIKDQYFALIFGAIQTETNERVLNKWKIGRQVMKYILFGYLLAQRIISIPECWSRFDWTSAILNEYLYTLKNVSLHWTVNKSDTDDFDWDLEARKHKIGV